MSLWYPKVAAAKKKAPLGLFRKVCASIILGEILQEIEALRTGETHPMILMIDEKNKLILFPEFRTLCE